MQLRFALWRRSGHGLPTVQIGAVIKRVESQRFEHDRANFHLRAVRRSEFKVPHAVLRAFAVGGDFSVEACYQMCAFRLYLVGVPTAGCGTCSAAANSSDRA